MLLLRCGRAPPPLAVDAVFRIAVQRRHCSLSAADARRLRKEQEKLAEAARPRRVSAGPLQDLAAASTAAEATSSAPRRQSSWHRSARSGDERIISRSTWQWYELWRWLRSLGWFFRRVMIHIVLLILPITPFFYLFHHDGIFQHECRVEVCDALPPAATVLEINFGYAELTAMLIEHLKKTGGSVVAVDGDDYFIRTLQKAYKRAKETPDNLELVHHDVLKLTECKQLQGRRFSHAIIGMQLHTMEPLERVCLLEQVAPFVSDTILIYDHTDDASGVRSFAKFRNLFIKLVSHRRVIFNEWQESGGVPVLVAAVQEGRASGKLAIPELEIVDTTVFDSGTAALYRVRVSGEVAQVKKP